MVPVGVMLIGTLAFGIYYQYLKCSSKRSLPNTASASASAASAASAASVVTAVGM
jgi:hypothetical protein